MNGTEFRFKAEDIHDYGICFGVIGSTTALILCSLGASYGTAKAGVAVAAISSTKPELIVKSLMPIIMAGIIGIYGLVASVLIINDMKINKERYLDYRAYMHLGAGISVGVSGLMAGIAIGVIGDSGIRGNHLQISLYIAMIITLIFAEVLGLYGLIVAVVIFTKVD